MTLAAGDRADDVEALLCDGEIAVARQLSEVADCEGLLVVPYGFAFSAIAQNWWRRYDRRGWDDFAVPVVGASRDGPAAQNAFLRAIDSPFRSFADVNGRLLDAFGVREERDHMAGVEVATRSAFLLDADLTVEAAWTMDDWISPMPVDEIESAVRERTEAAP